MRSVRCDLQPLATWADTGYFGVQTSIVNSCSNSNLSFSQTLIGCAMMYNVVSMSKQVITHVFIHACYQHHKDISL